jgi:hypothetical protein
MVGIGNAPCARLAAKACIMPTSESFLVARSGEPRFQRLPKPPCHVTCLREADGRSIRGKRRREDTRDAVLASADGLSSPSWRSRALARSARTCSMSRTILRRSPAFTFESTCLQLRPYGKRDRQITARQSDSSVALKSHAQDVIDVDALKRRK